MDDEKKSRERKIKVVHFTFSLLASSNITIYFSQPTGRVKQRPDGERKLLNNRAAGWQTVQIYGKLLLRRLL